MRSEWGEKKEIRKERTRLLWGFLCIKVRISSQSQERLGEYKVEPWAMWREEGVEKQDPDEEMRTITDR